MSDRLVWFKSSYSDSQGSDCLEVACPWRESSHDGAPHATHVRDSKLGARGPEFAVAAQTWAAFVGHARNL
ncbi:DUF397 domain-containing protein [Streptomyces sp. NPDC005251]|uniref:DUF397 domain-containing protein n=1 Tax=unclassified Streptomyces TaxID=2593676 RepID=UPI0033B7D938